MSTQTADVARQIWLQERLKGIGASEAPTILGLNPYKSAYALWCEKTGIVEPADLSENEAVGWGIDLEPLIAKKYAKVTGRELDDPGRFTVQRHAEYEWMVATLDRVILPPVEGREGPGCLEIKTTGSRHAQEWEEDAPVGYQVQLQHQLAVTGFGWGALCVLIGGQDLRYIDLARNDEFIAHMIGEELKFLEMVKRQEPPAVDASDSTKAALAKAFPMDKGAEILMPPESCSWYERIANARMIIKEAEKDIQECENLIKSAIGDASTGLRPDGSGGWSWKFQKRAGYTVQPKEFRVLREVKI